MTIWQRIGRWALGEGGEGLSDARLAAGWQKAVAPPSSGSCPAGLPPKPPIRVEVTASRFTDDERFAVASALRDWIHEQPWSECWAGADTCPDWPKAFEIRDVALGALEASRRGPSGGSLRPPNTNGSNDA